MNTLQENHPTEAIVLGGNWEPNAKRPILSLETRTHVLAAGVLALRGDINSAIFSGGLVDPTTQLNEAEAMAEYFTSRFPSLADFPVTLDSECYDTVSSAKSVAAIVEARGKAEDQRYLLTSKSHLKRSETIFRREGLDVEPVEAEPLLGEISVHHGVFARDYLRSPRYAKRLVLETVMRMALAVDKDGKISQKLAGSLRKGIR